MDGKARDTIEKVIAGTRSVLMRCTDELRADATALDLRTRFQGCCGLAQCVAGYALQDAGLRVRPVATQSLRDCWYGHAALTVALDDQARTLLLIDPTFVQFTGAAEPGSPYQPAEHLSRSAPGRALLSDVLGAGFAELTPQRAAHYLASFCEGRRPMNGNQAILFLRDPPPHAYHFRKDAGSDAFSRENLSKLGLLLR